MVRGRSRKRAPLSVFTLCVTDDVAGLGRAAAQAAFRVFGAGEIAVAVADDLALALALTFHVRALPDLDGTTRANTVHIRALLGRDLAGRSRTTAVIRALPRGEAAGRVLTGEITGLFASGLTVALVHAGELLALSAPGAGLVRLAGAVAVVTGATWPRTGLVRAGVSTSGRERSDEERDGEEHPA